ncbi:hypothetical protein B0J12DRAFT_640172 [Macrophomina phaseolina]|uniref:Secreted protein n=1 Tax=Macrophomina phaseolina TaxID=35725 RepID=A0ABQ8GVV6_9PEZI|nr:hypothetical protein B0J12DRAFT_640172 [Macrophomina phaseolina]
MRWEANVLFFVFAYLLTQRRVSSLPVFPFMLHTRLSLLDACPLGFFFPFVHMCGEKKYSSFCDGSFPSLPRFVVARAPAACN